MHTADLAFIAVLFNRVPQDMQWGSVDFKGSMRVPRFFLWEMIFASACWSVIMKFFRSSYRIQILSRPVGCKEVECGVATGVSRVNIRLLPFSTSDNIRFLHSSLI